MIKRIACPTDFSSAANNAVEYAARFAQHIGSDLTLIHVQHVPLGEGTNLVAGGELSTLPVARAAAKILDDMCLEISEAFGIQCDHEIILSMGLFERVVSDELNRFDLTIVGTNGADTLSQFYFGSHSYRIIKNASNPVLLIPEGFVYSEISNLLFATAFKTADNLHLLQLKQITDNYNPVIKAVTIQDEAEILDTTDSNEFCKLLQRELNYTNRIEYMGEVQEREPNSLQAYMKETNSNLMALCLKKHSIFYHLFHTDIVKNLTTYLEYPMYIFYE